MENRRLNVPQNFALGNVQSAILETVVTLNVQSKVEHLTSIAYLLDFLTSTRVLEPRKQQKMESRT